MNDSLVKFIKLEDLGLSPWQTALAIMLVIIGFVVYYIVPYAFTFNDLALFLFIFTIILLGASVSEVTRLWAVGADVCAGMLMGFSLLAQIVQPLLERVLLWVSMWCVSIS
jgi:hypothetical protein